MTLSPTNNSFSQKAKSSLLEPTGPLPATATALEQRSSETAISILQTLNNSLASLTSDQPKTLQPRERTSPIKELEIFDNPEIPIDPLSYIYLFTNEFNLDSSAQFLTETPKVPNGCHVGFSGMHNFDIMALRKSTYGLICDCNKNSTLVLQDIVKILRASPNRKQFIENLYSVLAVAIKKETLHSTLSQVIKKEDLVFKEIPFHKDLLVQSMNPHSWLFSDESFHHIRTLALEEKICIITQDARNSKAFEEISQKLREKKISLDTLYLSNIGNYILDNEQTDRPLFQATVKALVDESTISINCPLPPFIPSVHWAPELHALLYKNHTHQISLVQYTFKGKDLFENLFMLKKEIPPKPTTTQDTNNSSKQISLEKLEKKADQLKQELTLDGIFRNF